MGAQAPRHRKGMQARLGSPNIRFPEITLGAAVASDDAVLDRLSRSLLSKPPSLAGEDILVPDWMPDTR